MANVLTELPKQARKGGGGRSESYPFDEWLGTEGAPTGVPIELVAGEDYKSKNATILNLVRKAAERRGFEVKTVTTENGVAVLPVPADPNKKKRGRRKASENGA
jgi:hypothetical protein